MDIKTLHYIEEKYSLYDKEIFGFKYWIYSKFDIDVYHFSRVFDGKSGLARRKISTVSVLQDAFPLLWNSLFRGRVKNEHVDMLVLNHERRLRNGDYYDCIYTDDLLEKFTSYDVIERTIAHRHFRPVRTKRLVYSDGIEVTSNLSAALNRKFLTDKFRSAYHTVKDDLADCLEELEEIYGKKLNKDAIYMIVVQKMFVYLAKKRYFEKIIKKTSPKLVLEVVAYNMDCMILNELSEVYGYDTVELQHGTISVDHKNYNYPKSVGRQIQFPRHLLTFSQVFTDGVNFPGVDIRTVGYPYLEKMMEKYPREEHDGYVVTFFSDILNNRRMEEMICDFYELVKKNGDDVRIVFKTHPAENSEWQKRYPRLPGLGIEIYADNDINAYYCFARSDAMVSTASTTLFEGLAYELDTFIMRNELIDSVRSLIDGKCAVVFDDTDELYEYVVNAAKGNKDKGKMGIWPKDSLNSIEHILKDLMADKE